MILGTITARHVILHPITMISMLGFFGFVRMLAKCVDSRPSCFMDSMMR